MNIDKKIATRQSYGEALAELGEKKTKYCSFGCRSFRIN